MSVDERESDAQPARSTKGLFWGGRIVSALPALFLLMDAAMKLVKPEFVVQATVELGYSEESIRPLGIVLLACTALYLIPRTAVLGAILLTGYLGGAVDADACAVQTGRSKSCFPSCLECFCGAVCGCATSVSAA